MYEWGFWLAVFINEIKVASPEAPFLSMYELGSRRQVGIENQTHPRS
jgi:hypothetical protein